MAKGKVTTNITKQEYAFIDGATGQEITREQFVQKYSGVNIPGHKVNVGEEAGEGEKREDN